MKYEAVDENDVSDNELTADLLAVTRQSDSNPHQMEIVRKGNNFRVVMERKLGVDWEHDPQECPSEILQSVQTN